ncbi:hypothetical protein [Nocardia cyriacigeorgica]|uniref:hypothetical protein n=1 Tax=Nocardia cyriacigeorgica TaxID=135487 RepID=UPI002456D337|nr:hypothetical protein [Nocardia cyriacigeorgica]
MHGSHPVFADIQAALAGSCDGEELTELGGGLACEIESTLEAVWPASRSLAASPFRDGGRSTH